MTVVRSLLLFPVARMFPSRSRRTRPVDDPAAPDTGESVRAFARSIGRRLLSSQDPAPLYRRAQPLAATRTRAAFCAAPVLTGTPLLLNRMRHELSRSGQLQTSTAAWMWTVYAAYAALITATLTNAPTTPPLPPALRGVAVTLAAAGGALNLAGTRRFAGPAQLTGTAAGNLVTGGAYRYSRNPQYTGCVIALTGMAITRRSSAALALTAGLAATYWTWIPVEEQHLARHFGEPYRRYRDATHRWLGPPEVTDRLRYSPGDRNNEEKGA